MHASAITSTPIPNSHFRFQYNKAAPIRARLWASILSIAAVANRATMVTTTASSSSNSRGGAFTTLKETVTFEKEIKKSKFIALAASVSDEQSAFSFLSQGCSCYSQLLGIQETQVGDQYRSNDDGEPSGTAGKPIQSAIQELIEYFGGIKLGTGGLVRAYGGVTSECLRNAPTHLVKSKVRMGVEVPFDLIGILYHQLQSFQAEDIEQDYETGKDGITMVTFRVDFDHVEKLEDAIKTNCSRELVFYK
ncbi:hypothetical protein ACLB2K_006234 [Fragaria x ananassa]